MNLTLIMTSQDRAHEVSEFFDKLKHCKFPPNFHVNIIFIAQTPAIYDTVKAVRPVDCMEIHIMRSNQCSLSQARNLGLRKVVADNLKTDVIGFPDDDCYYEPGIFQKVIQWYEAYENTKNCAGIAFKYLTKQRYPKRISAKNLLGNVISYSVFVKYNLTQFDERLGVGAKFGAGEETDYILSLIKQDKYLVGSDEMMVMHPENDIINNQRRYTYARGHGFLARKWLSASWEIAIFISLRILVGPFLKFALRKISFKEMKIETKGRWEGFLS